MLASLVDSCLDLLNGLVLFLTRRFMDKKEYYNYPQVGALLVLPRRVDTSLAHSPTHPPPTPEHPQGKKRLEPVGVLIFATAMVRRERRQ